MQRNHTIVFLLFRFTLITYNMIYLIIYNMILYVYIYIYIYIYIISYNAYFL